MNSLPPISDEGCIFSVIDWLHHNIEAEKKAMQWEEFTISDAQLYAETPPKDYRISKPGRKKIDVYNKLLEVAEGKKDILDLSKSEIELFRGAKNDESGISGIKVSDILYVICTFINLVILSITGDEITYLPNEISNLSHLKDLDVSNTRITKLPETIIDIQSLQSLDVSNTLIDRLPHGLSNLKGLRKLAIENTYVQIPLNIRQNINDAKIILDEVKFIESIQNEAKIIMVGEGGVGKTSLIQRLVYNKFNPNELETSGIEINQWIMDDSALVNSTNGSDPNRNGALKNEAKVRVNIWDFGGQEIMHATHQFFFTKRSLYLLVLDVRQTQRENRVGYWLNLIEFFSQGSPLIIIGNKIDQNPFDIDKAALQRKHKNITGVLSTSAATGEGVEELRTLIARNIALFQSPAKSLPDGWTVVKNHIELLSYSQNFITYERYCEVCNDHNIRDEASQHELISYLHDLGAILYFQGEYRLAELGILNPQWVTNGVYKILNSHTLFQNKGVLTVSMLDVILNLPEYPRGKRLFIVDMMKKFELCYDIDPDKTFLVPDLLPKDQPDLNFNGIPAFEYAYPVLPSSVITRFIVRMNQKIDDGFVWRTGVVLKIGENKALVKADIEDRKITIAIDGLEHTRRDALSAIRFQLDEIHASIKGLDPQKKVPVPNAPKAEPLKYEYLLKLERAGQETLLVENGNDLVTVNVRQMLSAIESESQRKESATNVTTIYNVNTGGGDFTGRDKSISAGDRGIVVDGNAKGNLVSGDENEVAK